MHFQQSEYAVCPLLFVPRGPYTDAYRQAIDWLTSLQQGWLLAQGGKTFRALPTKRINLPLTAKEYAAKPNFYYEAHNFLKANRRYDSTGQRVEFCNWKRLYVIHCVGDVRTLGNMAGRSSWDCPPAADNPLEPWGPGVSAGFSGGALELLRGNEKPIVDAGIELQGSSSGLHFLNICIAAILHEMEHCKGVQHPGQPGTYAEGAHERNGDAVWRTPMGAHWNWPHDANGLKAALLPEEVVYCDGSHFFA